MNPQRILIIACAACAALLSNSLLPTSLLAQWNTRPLVPVPPVNAAPANSTTGPIVTLQPGTQFGQPGTQFVQPGTQFGAQPGVVTTVPPTVTAPPVITSQPGTQFVQPGFGPAPVITGPQAVPNMPAPPPGSFGGPVYDPYYQQTPGGAPPPPAVLGAPLLPGGQNWGTFGSTAGITPRAGGGTQIGEDVGLDDAMTWFQGFIPVFQTPGQNITFIDTRAINFHEASGAFGFNLLGGYRWYSPPTNRIYGAYASYDYRNTGRFDFDQISFGAESLGPLWDFRVNGYLLLSDSTQFASVTNPMFMGNNLIVTANFIDAYSGFDAEVGRNFTPASPTVDVRVFGGGYGFLADSSNDAYGVRGRIEATWWDRVSLGASVQYDDVFNTTVLGTLSILFGGANRANPCACPTIADRLGDPVHKNMHVVLGSRSQPNVTIINPADGMPLQIQHVDSNNPGAGVAGTFEDPLVALPANPANNFDIVLLHAGSMYNGSSIIMDGVGQRLLGDGASAPHTTPSQFGTIPLPRANPLLAQPIINLAPQPAVTIGANNVEVAGLNITAPVQDGIFGSGVTGININRNMISMTAGGDGVDLDGMVSGTITGNVVTGAGGGLGNHGFEIGTWTGGTISGNTASGNGGAGYFIGTISGGTISGNIASMNTTEGFDIGTMSAGTFSGNMASMNTLDGFDFNNVTGGVIRGNMASMNTVDGFFFSDIDGGLIDSNTASMNTDDGFDLNNMFTGGTFSNNVSNNNTDQGYDNTGGGGTAVNNTGAGNAGGNTFP